MSTPFDMSETVQDGGGVPSPPEPAPGRNIPAFRWRLLSTSDALAREERDAAVARAERAERERDDVSDHRDFLEAEASRLACERDAAVARAGKAEAERDEARANAEALEGVWAEIRKAAEHLGCEYEWDDSPVKAVAYLAEQRQAWADGCDSAERERDEAREWAENERRWKVEASDEADAFRAAIEQAADLLEYPGCQDEDSDSPQTMAWATLRHALGDDPAPEKAEADVPTCPECWYGEGDHRFGCTLAPKEWTRAQIQAVAEAGHHGLADGVWTVDTAPGTACSAVELACAVLDAALPCLTRSHVPVDERVRNAQVAMRGGPREYTPEQASMMADVVAGREPLIAPPLPVNEKAERERDAAVAERDEARHQREATDLLYVQVCRERDALRAAIEKHADSHPRNEWVTVADMALWVALGAPPVPDSDKGEWRRTINTVLGLVKVAPECEAQAVCTNGDRCWKAGHCLRSPAPEKAKADTGETHAQADDRDDAIHIDCGDGFGLCGASPQSSMTIVPIDLMSGCWTCIRKFVESMSPPRSPVPVDEGPEAGYIDVVFDGPPDHDAPRFIEVEDENGKGIRVGEWIERGPHEYWVLRIPRAVVGSEQPPVGAVGPWTQEWRVCYQDGSSSAWLPYDPAETIGGDGVRFESRWVSAPVRVVGGEEQ